MSAASIADAPPSPAGETQSVVPSPLMVADLGCPTAPLAATLGDYELHGELGRGGMGIVYEATQISLRRSVAIKTLPFAAVLDQQQVARFRNEAQAAASLHHPHIVPVYAVGCERGVHYYSMQLIDGDTLEHTLSALQANEAEKQRGEKLSELRREEAIQAAAQLTEELHHGDKSEKKTPAFAGQVTSRAVKDHGSTVQSVRDRRSIHSVVRLFVDVAAALDYAHEQGVVHRDIKPSNLLIDGSGKIWVADFGLARCRGAGNLTADGAALGTARYMSPEQVAGRPQAVDHRTDVYSLGITLYEMLTLQPAFSAPSREQLLRAVESQQPTPPRQLNSAIETDLETIVLKAIAKNKDDRYATAGDMAEDLRRYLDGLPTLARRPGKVDLAFRWALRHRQMVLLTLLIFTLAAGGLSVATVRAKHQALIARTNLRSAFDFFDRYSALAVTKMAKLPGGEVLMREMLLESQKFTGDFLFYANEDPTFVAETAKARLMQAAIASMLGDTKLAEEQYLRAIEQFEAIEQQHHADRALVAEHALCLHNLAAMRKKLGRYQDAMTLYERAAEMQQLAFSMPGADYPLVPNWAATQTNFAKLQWERGEIDVAIARMTQTESKLAHFMREAPHNVELRLPLVECRNALAGLMSESNPTLAEDLFRKNIAQLEDAPTMPPPPPQWSIAGAVDSRSEFASMSPVCQRAVAQNNLANLLTKKQAFTDAITLTTSAIETFRSVLSKNPDDRVVQQQLAVTLNNYGQILFSRQATGDTDEADAAFEQAQQSFEKLIAVDDSDPHLFSRLAGVLHNLAIVKQQRGELDLAVKDLTNAIEMQSIAVRKAPLNTVFRNYLQLHSESLDQLLHKINPSANSSVHGEQATTRRVGLDVFS